MKKKLMNNNFDKKDFYILLTGAIILLPIVFFPITTDLAIFIQSGKIIAQGGKPYVDFIDIKPPAIYYIYSFIYSIIGSGETALRLFDFFIQILTISLLYFIIKTNSDNKKRAAYSVIIYAFSYVALAHNQTMQIESWIPLLSLLMIYFAMKSDEKSYYLLISGIFAGIITALKFSMFFVIFLLPLADYFQHKTSITQSLKRFLITFSGFLLIIFLSLLPFADAQIRHSYGNIFRYLTLYAKYPPFNVVFIRQTLKAIAVFFGDKYSLLFSLLLFTGIFYSLKKTNNERNNKLNNFIIASFILLFLSVVAEKKFFPYHFSRIYAEFSALAALGAIFFIDSIKKIFKERKRHILTVILIVAFLTLLSPLTRWVAVLNPAVNYFANKQKYNEYYTRKEAVLLKYQIEVAHYIKQNSKPNDKTLVVSVASSIVNYYLGDYALNKFMLSCFFISSAHIKPWEKEALKLLQKSKWLVLQENDINYMANGHYMTSRKAFFSQRNYLKYLVKNFSLKTIIGTFYIYRKYDKKPKNKQD